MKRSISCGARPISASSSDVPTITARSGPWGVVSTLRVQRRSSASMTMSVKVPPISTASLVCLPTVDCVTSELLDLGVNDCDPLDLDDQILHAELLQRNGSQSRDGFPEISPWK